MSTREERESSSPLGVAGWLYADLFLALVIVGLAATTIRVSSLAPDEPAETVATTTTTIPTLQFQLSCTEAFLSPELLVLDSGLADRVTRWLEERIQERGWTLETAKPGLVFVYSGYDGEGDGQISQAKSRANEMAVRLRGSVPLLSNVEIRAGASQSQVVNEEMINIGGSGSFAAIVYFVYQGESADEICLNSTST